RAVRTSRAGPVRGPLRVRDAYAARPVDTESTGNRHGRRILLLTTGQRRARVRRGPQEGAVMAGWWTRKIAARRLGSLLGVAVIASTGMLTAGAPAARADGPSVTVTPTVGLHTPDTVTLQGT